jgi:hypothetical protein
MNKFVIGIGIALFASACATNPGRTSQNVPLQIPEPPPRAEMDPVAVVLETPAPPERPAAPPPARTPTAAPPPPAPAAAVVAPATPPTVVQTPEPPRTSPPPELQPAGPAGRTPTAAQVRDRIARTSQKLNSINRRTLNAGKRADYDSARRFLETAEAAVTGNNLLLAESSVGKAETLADGLR